MKAALLEAPHRMSVGAQPDPELPPGHVLVEVATAAICGTDVSIWAGKMPANIPIIPGHECTGTVASLAPDVGANGKRIASSDDPLGCPVEVRASQLAIPAKRIANAVAPSATGLQLPSEVESLACSESRCLKPGSASAFAKS